MALTHRAGGPGSIPAVGKSKKVQYSDGFSASQEKVVGYWNGTRHNLSGLVSPCGINNYNAIEEW